MNTEDVGLWALRDWKVNNSCQPRVQLLTLLQITSLNLASSPMLKTPISLQHNVYKWSWDNCVSNHRTSQLGRNPKWLSGATQVPGSEAPELQCSGSNQLCLYLQCAGGTVAAGTPDLLPLVPECLLQPMISVSSRWPSKPAASHAWLSLPGSLTAGKWYRGLCTLLEMSTFEIRLSLGFYRKVGLRTPN